MVEEWKIRAIVIKTESKIYKPTLPLYNCPLAGKCDFSRIALNHYVCGVIYCKKSSINDAWRGLPLTFILTSVAVGDSAAVSMLL